MKKIFALVMVVTILGAFLAGCNKAADDTSGTGSTTTGGTATTGGTTGK
ncbi:MAG TPA: hypothetical protein VG820_02380 [Fimbriimonadaceae bacterium]|nr:hypothetical protein [Fimbriimonadaceae bacterium]